MPDRTKLERFGRPTITKLFDGRRRIVRRWKLKGNWTEEDQLEIETFVEFGKQDEEFSDAFLVEQPTVAPRGEGAEEMLLTEIYEEVFDTLVEVGGGPTISTDTNGRRTVTRNFVVRTSVSDAVKFGTEGVTKDPDSSRFPDHYLQTQRVSEGKVITRITRRYVEVTGSPVQVGDDNLSTDRNGRGTLSRRFIILPSASYTRPVVGDHTVTVDGKTMVYAGERRSGDASVRRITRRYVEATNDPVQIGKDRVSTDANGRKTVSQLWILRSTASYSAPSIGSVYNSIFVLTAETEQADKAIRRVNRRYVQATAEWVAVGQPVRSTDSNDRNAIRQRFVARAGTSVPDEIGDVVDGFTGFVLQRQSVRGDEAIEWLDRTYIELTDDEVEVGNPRYGTDANDRQTISRTFVRTPAATLSGDQAIGIEVYDGAVLTAKRVTQDAVRAQITYSYIEATETPVQVGKDRISKDSNDRRTITQMWVVLSSATYTPPAIGSVYDDDFALATEQEQADEAIRRISRRYIEARNQWDAVGQPVRGTDSNGRQTIRQRFIARTGTSVTNPIGQVVDGFTGFVLQRQTVAGDSAVERLDRTYIQLTSSEVEVGNPRYSTDANDRKTITRTFVRTPQANLSGTLAIGTATFDGAVLAAKQVVQDAARAQITYRYQQATGSWEPLGTPTRSEDANGRKMIRHRFIALTGTGGSGDIGDVLDGFTGFVLQSQSLSGNTAVQTLQRTYIEVTNTPVQVGKDRISRDENDRRTISQLWIVASSASYTAPSIGSVYASNFALAGEQEQADQAVRRITRNYVEATATPVQIGEDSVGRDSNGRTTVSQQWIVRASATYTPPEIGSVYDDDFALDSETERAGAAIRRITRNYVEATASVEQIGGDEISRDAQGRRTLRRRFIQRASESYTPPDPGDVVAGIYAFSVEQESNSQSVRRIARTFIEAGASPVEVGRRNYSRDGDNRLQIGLTMVQIATATEPAEIQQNANKGIGVEVVEGCVLSQAQVTQDASVARISKTFTEATETPVQIGLPQIRQMAGTNSPNVDGGAREWTYRYLVRAPSDGSDISEATGVWLAYNADGPEGSDQKLVDQGIVHRGIAFAVISRVFVEVPDEWEGGGSRVYLFPGAYYLTGTGSVVVSNIQPPTRRTVDTKVVETYSTTKPAATTPADTPPLFQPIHWLRTVVERDGLSPRPQTYSNYLGEVNYDGDYTEAGTSDPVTYPTGEQVIESEVALWRGRIWRKRDTIINFGGS